MSIIVFQSKLRELKTRFEKSIKELEDYIKKGLPELDEENGNLPKDPTTVVLKSASLDFVTVIENFKELVLKLFDIHKSSIKEEEPWTKIGIREDEYEEIFKSNIDNFKLIEKAIYIDIVKKTNKETLRKLVDYRNDICHGRYDKEQAIKFYNELNKTIELFQSSLKEIKERYRI